MMSLYVDINLLSIYVEEIVIYIEIFNCKLFRYIKKNVIPIQYENINRITKPFLVKFYLTTKNNKTK